jgi:PAS domain S-box-containing protein
MRKPRARPRTEELQRLVHELRVQQLELERQNEEIHHMRRELEAERDRVADLYQLAPVAHLTLDRVGTIVEATVLAVALLGVDRRRLTHRRLHELVMPADWPTLSRHLVDVFGGAARRTCDVGILKGRDTARLVRISSVAVPDAEGQSTRCRTALMDITERKQAEEGLKDSRAQFESIIISALDAIVTVNGDGRVVLMNPAAEQMFSCTAATAIGHPFDRFVQESSRQWYRAVIMADADNDVTRPPRGRLGTMVARRADGTEVPVEASISEVVGSWGRLFTVILRDVSARKRAEHALAERLRLEQLLTVLAMAFGHRSTVVDFDREVQGGLRAVVDFLKVDRGSLIEFSQDGKVARCWANEDWMDARDFPWLTACLRRGDFVMVSRFDELPEEAAMDRQSYLTYRVKPQVGLPLEAGGRVVGGLVFSTIGAERVAWDELKQQLHLLGEAFANLLSRKQAELEMQRLRQDLGHINRVATIGELTTSLAHELNQPLTAILSNAQSAQRILEADSVDLEEVREILTDIVEDDKRAGAIIHRLRGLLRKDSLEFTDLDVNELVGEVAGLVRGDVALRHASLRLELAPRLPRVRGDRVQLQQVVLNLILNGLDAVQEAGADGRTLVLRTGRESSAVVRVAARDFGTGINEADLGHIFQAFYTTKTTGLGMGLAIARSIVEVHGRQLEAENNPDGGATFSFTLPVSKEGHDRPNGAHGVHDRTV